MSQTDPRSENDTSDIDDDDIAFASVDFTGVNFDDGSDCDNTPTELDDRDQSSLLFERRILLPNVPPEDIDKAYGDTLLEGRISSRVGRIHELANQLSGGHYAEALRGETAQELFGNAIESLDGRVTGTMASIIRDRVVSYGTSVTKCVEVEMVAVASLNLFLQVNYTGPSLDRGLDPTGTGDTGDSLDGINPHRIFESHQNFSGRKASLHDQMSQKAEVISSAATSSKSGTDYHNAVLSELAVDGDWPCQVCSFPYLLLLGRAILLALADPLRADWTHSTVSDDAPGSKVLLASANDDDRFRYPMIQSPPHEFVSAAKCLQAASLWSARAAVAHQRLLQGDESSVTLWDEVRTMFLWCVASFCEGVDKSSIQTYKERTMAANVMLEWGLAQHHFDREGKGKGSFQEAMEFSGLRVEVTGAIGKRTKFQQDATAQMLVRATPLKTPVSLPDKARENGMQVDGDPPSTTNNDGQPGGRSTNVSLTARSKEVVKAQMVEHDQEEILLERIMFQDEKENVVETLSVLDQAILLALCLDVKNTNPMDGLTAEQMGAYLERVLHQHDDWMVYATALLERAWLECERVHGRERAILQIQALADQHANRLTLTQSTFQSVEDSAPAQDRLKNLHTIVYPPRWSMMRDLAERYAKLGVVTTAAEIFEKLELWDEVVECYRHAGKESRAEHIVRERLALAETPRMWAALGDLTNDPSHYEKSLELSRGRFSNAYVALGRYHFEKGDLALSSDYYKKALKIKPLVPTVWFRLGTISMRLGHWETALQAFSEVVQQEPEEGDAWANVAAIHMHNKNPAEAYPALVESLKQNRNNWRVWINKLYVCIDLKKYDEAIQACIQLLDFKSKSNASESVPALEEKCVRAIVSGAIFLYEKAVASKEPVAMDSARRTVCRASDLLDRISSSMKSEAWIYEIRAFFNERMGQDERVMEDLMKEYRALQAVNGWETDTSRLEKVYSVVSQITALHRKVGSKERLVKSKFLLNSVITKIRAAYFDETTIPEEVGHLEGLLAEIEALITAA